MASKLSRNNSNSNLASLPRKGSLEDILSYSESGSLGGEDEEEISNEQPTQQKLPAPNLNPSNNLKKNVQAHSPTPPPPAAAAAAASASSALHSPTNTNFTLNPPGITPISSPSNSSFLTNPASPLPINPAHPTNADSSKNNPGPRNIGVGNAAVQTVAMAEPLLNDVPAPFFNKIEPNNNPNYSNQFYNHSIPNNNSSNNNNNNNNAAHLLQNIASLFAQVVMSSSGNSGNQQQQPPSIGSSMLQQQPSPSEATAHSPSNQGDSNPNTASPSPAIPTRPR